MLGVGTKTRGQQPALNDDTYAPLKCTWYQNLVRIAVIGDGSCFVHAVLKGFDRRYQENPSAKFRIDRVQNVRRDLGLIMGQPDDRYGRSHWLTTNGGAFPRMAMAQLLDESLIADMEVDFSLAGLQRLFNSSRYLGQEIYEFIANVLNIDVFIFTCTNSDIYHLNNTRQFGIERPAIVIIGNTIHYELVAVDTSDGFQTVFMPGDPFLQSIILQFDLGWAPSDFDPDESFIDGLLSVFVDRKRIGEDEDDVSLEFRLPETWNAAFTPEDPMRVQLRRLAPRITNILLDRGITIVTVLESGED